MFCIAPRSWQPESTSRWRIILDRAKRKQCRLRGVGSPNEHQPHAKHTEGSRRPSVQGKVKANRTAVQGACVRGFRVCRNAWRSWGSSRRRAKRELSARRQIQGKPGALETYQSDEVTCPLHGCYRGSSGPISDIGRRPRLTQLGLSRPPARMIDMQATSPACTKQVGYANLE